MTFVLLSQFNVYLLWVNACLTWSLNCILNVKALESAFNQEKTLIEAFSVIMKTDGLFAALVGTLHCSTYNMLTINSPLLCSVTSVNTETVCSFAL